MGYVLLLLRLVERPSLIFVGCEWVTPFLISFSSHQTCCIWWSLRSSFLFCSFQWVPVAEKWKEGKEAMEERKLTGRYPKREEKSDCVGWI